MIVVSAIMMPRITNVQDVPVFKGGDARVDNCGVCDNEIAIAGGLRRWSGDSILDDCGVCDNDATNDNTTCRQDCAGVWGGDAQPKMIVVFVMTTPRE